MLSQFIFNISQIGMSFHPPESLGFQQLYVDAETKFSKEPLHSFVFTSVPQGGCNYVPLQVLQPKNRNDKYK